MLRQTDQSNQAASSSSFNSINHSSQSNQSSQSHESKKRERLLSRVTQSSPKTSRALPNAPGLSMALLDHPKTSQISQILVDPPRLPRPSRTFVEPRRPSRTLQDLNWDLPEPEDMKKTFLYILVLCTWEFGAPAARANSAPHQNSAISRTDFFSLLRLLPFRV